MTMTSRVKCAFVGSCLVRSVAVRGALAAAFIAASCSLACQAGAVPVFEYGLAPLPLFRGASAIRTEESQPGGVRRLDASGPPAGAWTATLTIDAVPSQGLAGTSAVHDSYFGTDEIRAYQHVEVNGISAAASSFIGGTFDVIVDGVDFILFGTGHMQLHQATPGGGQGPMIFGNPPLAGPYQTALLSLPRGTYYFDVEVHAGFLGRTEETSSFVFRPIPAPSAVITFVAIGLSRCIRRTR